MEEITNNTEGQPLPENGAAPEAGTETKAPAKKKKLPPKVIILEGVGMKF